MSCAAYVRYVAMRSEESPGTRIAICSRVVGNTHTEQSARCEQRRQSSNTEAPA
ncbi:MAG: hypothetical protein RI996_493 [Candidatus Parcubacteria bacterium]